MSLPPYISRWKRNAVAVPDRPGFELDHTAPVATFVETKAEKRFIARQAIFDKTNNVFAYELLARSGWENYFSGDSDDATRKMISDGVLYGYEELTHGRPAFINCTRESLVQGLVTMLPKAAVLEVLETVVPDEPVISACRTLKRSGYQIALDDFRLSPKMDGLLELADYIKVDFRLSDLAERKKLLASLKGARIKLIAEKVETDEEYKQAESEGFDYFQGYFFCRPTVFTVQRPPTTGRNHLRLFAAVCEKDCNVVQIAELLKAEPGICYQLLRLVNSALFGLSTVVESLAHALMLVGEDQYKKLVLNAITAEACNHRSRELLVRVLHHARFLELMAPFTGQSAQEQYLFGLLSFMEVMLQAPSSMWINALQLRDEVKAALNGKVNEVSLAQQLLSFYDEGNWEACLRISRDLDISEQKLTSIYHDSLGWAELAATPEHARLH